MSSRRVPFCTTHGSSRPIAVPCPLSPIWLLSRMLSVMRRSYVIGTRVAARLPNAEYVELVDRGHNLPLEDPATFVKRLNEVMLTMAGKGPSRLWVPGS